MRSAIVVVIILLVAGALLWFNRSPENTPPVAEAFSFVPGPVNAAIFERNGARLAVYGPGDAVSKNVDQVLLTHHRRDVVAPARQSIADGARAVAPAAEKAYLEKPQEFWKEFTKKRFHDYAQQSTKILVEPLAVGQWVKEGDLVSWQGLDFKVLDTPGYTRGAVSYLVDVDGKRIAFTGDLIYGDGQVVDLYSFQDAAWEAKVGGYHGYAARLASLIPSLRKIAAQKPDLLVPAHGPIVRNPAKAIDRVIARVQRIYANYLSTNALNWYFKEERMTICGKRVLGPEARVELMSYAQHEEPPQYVWGERTSRMLVADNGHAFLMDCGYQKVIDEIKKLQAAGKVKKVDGIFVTHCHDDHTDYVQKAAEEFGCPVYAIDMYQDVLENPSAWRLPALTTNPIKNVRAMKDGQSMGWQEFELTFYHYPGQMLHHGGLLAKKKGESKPIFFVGDSFSPSGMDDYCLLNRNLVHEDAGYFRCLKMLREFKGNYWLINEHIPFVFTFNDKELDYLENRYHARRADLKELFPWDDPNYGIDERWAELYPYGATVQQGTTVDLEARIVNHSPRKRTFTVTPNLPAGMKLTKAPSRLELEPRQESRVPFQVLVSAPGLHVVTADIVSEGMNFPAWIEALVTVE